MSTRLMKIIAWWQIVCGALGIAMYAAAYLDWLPGGRAWLEQTIGWINYYGGLGFFSFAIAAGRSLLKGEGWGLWASVFCQLVQVVSFAVLQGPHVHISVGPFVGVVLSTGMVKFSAGFNSSFFFGTRVAGPSFELSINAIAAIWAVLLYREARREGRPTLPAAA
jgi:hypothetical protein